MTGEFRRSAAWSTSIEKRSAELYSTWDVAALPSHLRRNSLDYYYLSVWPGLCDLDDYRTSQPPPRPAAPSYAYLHLPFCSGLCNFCSYFVVVEKPGTQSPRIAHYVSDVLKQVDIELDQGGAFAVNYLYIGGGTPSLLPPADLDSLLAGLSSRGVISDTLLGTLECHPEVFSDRTRGSEILAVLSSHGIRRISVGLQTDNENLLQSTNRRHHVDEFDSAIECARSAGFLVNVDLMYGLPTQTLQACLDAVGTVLERRPESISAYYTFVDFGTRMWRDVQQGSSTLPEHQLVQTQHIAMRIALEEAGYSELPNDFYALLEEDPSKFNQDTLPSDAHSLALGAGSYGYYRGFQYFNYFDLTSYANAVRSGRSPVWRAKVLTPDEDMRRDVMFSFKNSPNLNRRLFTQRYGVDPLDSYASAFAELFRLDLVHYDDDYLWLTAKGR